MSEFEAYQRARSNTWEAMWEKVRELDLDQTNNWINAVTPLKNMTIDFRGVHVIDVDVHEALKNWRRDLEMSDR